MTYGVGTAIVRAVTAIPSHACFGVFMGVFYGFAKRFERSGDSSLSRFCRLLAVIIPALLHGAYDYIATSQTGNLYFLCFVAALFVVSYILVGKMSKRDSYI